MYKDINRVKSVKLIVADGDDLKKKIVFNKKNPSFLFIITKEKIWYMNTTAGIMWTIPNNSAMRKKAFGQGHQMLVMK